MVGVPTFPTHSQARANASPPTYQEVIAEARHLLAPMAAQRGLDLRAAVSGRDLIAAEVRDATRERIINLMANAVALAPEKSAITVTFDPGSNRVAVWIANPSQSHDLERSVVDTHGNPFRIRTEAGRGTELCTWFQPTPLGDLP